MKELIPDSFRVISTVPRTTLVFSKYLSIFSLAQFTTDTKNVHKILKTDKCGLALHFPTLFTYLSHKTVT